MSFSEALARLKAGQHLARAGWNGKGQWVGLQHPRYLSPMTQPYLYIRTVTGDHVPWVVSQSDLLAEDWVVVE